MNNFELKRNLENLKILWQREKLLAISSICVLTITFFILGTFFAIISLTQTGLRDLQEQAQVTVFFKDDFSQDQILNLKNNLEKDKRVLSVNYISKNDAFKMFSDLNKNEPLLLEAITPSILPASLEIKTNKIQSLSQIASQFKKLDGVEDVKFFGEVVKKFQILSNIVYAIGITIVIIFFIISYTIVIATLRMIINSKGKEIEILKLVGASDSYVKNPLIFQGTILGFVSACLASGLLMQWFLFVFKNLGFEKLLFFWFIPYYLDTWLLGLILSGLLILLGVFFGYLGSYIGVRKYLKY